MLNIYFENVITREKKRIAPLSRLRIVGTSLLDGDDQTIAVYHGGLWRHREQHFFIVGIESPCVIHFENSAIRSDPRGPFNPAWLVDGAIRTGEAQQTALARLDEHSGAWHVYADRTFWSAVVVQRSNGG